MALVILTQQGYDLQEFFFLFGHKAVVQKIIRNQANGIDGSLCMGSMATDARCLNPYAPVHPSDRYPVCFGALLQTGADYCAGLVGYRVMGHAALKIQDGPVFEPHTCKIAAQTALFPVAQGEFRVRGKKEYRLLIVTDIIFHVLHAAFLITSSHHPQAVGKGIAQVLEELSHIIRKDQGAFIIHNAPSHKVAVLYHHVIWVRVPSIACRNHIQMGNGADVRLLLAGKFCISKIILTIHGLKSHASCNLQCLVQCAPYLPAKGRACFRPGFHTGDIHHCFYVLNDVLHVCLNEIICLAQ